MTKRNRAKCRICGDEIESISCHHFVKCSCGEIYVDGGRDYWRAGANDFKNFIRLDETANKVRGDTMTTYKKTRNSKHRHGRAGVKR